MRERIVGLELDQLVRRFDGLVERALAAVGHGEPIPADGEGRVRFDGTAIAGDGLFEAALHEVLEGLTVDRSGVARHEDLSALLEARRLRGEVREPRLAQPPARKV